MPLYYGKVGDTLYPILAKGEKEACKKFYHQLVKHQREIKKVLLNFEKAHVKEEKEEKS